jgi:redox-sensing transcriptional repressor
VFADHGFRISAVFDVDPVRIGSPVGDTVVRPYSDMAEIVGQDHIMVGVLAVPGAAAQGVADDLVAAGLKIIFNYSDALLSVPSDVTVHTSSPAVELLYALYFYLT